MLIDSLRKDIPFFPYVNTGTLYDFYTGKFQAATNGLWVLNGGLSQCTGAMGRGQTYKSGIAGSMFSRALVIHPDAVGYVYESEGTIPGAERYDDFVPEADAVSERIAFKNSTICNLTDFYDDFNQLVDEKEKHRKDYIVESPFFNHRTGKPYKIWVPTFVLVDSFSRARSNKGDMQFDANSIDDSAMNTFWLQEGNIKTRIMNDLPGRAARAGIYVIMTAHVGDKKDLDPYNKSPKQLQYMKNADKMKNVGSNFEFLTTTLLQTLKASVMQNPKDKTCLYPHKFSTDVEVNQVDTMMVRCKNNASGMMLPFIVSQYQGILDDVTNFQFLRDNKDFGLDIRGNNQGFVPKICGVDGKVLSRNNLRAMTEEEYSISRALQLLAELCFMQNMWTTWRMPEYVHTTPECLAERLKDSKKCSVERVLQSTGVWSSSKQKRERLTILDILHFLDNENKTPVIVDMGKNTASPEVKLVKIAQVA